MKKWRKIDKKWYLPMILDTPMPGGSVEVIASPRAWRSPSSWRRETRRDLVTLAWLRVARRKCCGWGFQQPWEENIGKSWEIPKIYSMGRFLTTKNWDLWTDISRVAPKKRWIEGSSNEIRRFTGKITSTITHHGTWTKAWRSCCPDLKTAYENHETDIIGGLQLLRHAQQISQNTSVVPPKPRPVSNRVNMEVSWNGGTPSHHPF